MKKTLSILLVLVLSFAAFAQGKTESSAPAAAAAATTYTADDSWKTAEANITLWYSISGANGEFFKTQVQKFMAEHPNIHIEMTYTGNYSDTATKVSAAKLAGNGPDMVITSASQLYPGEDEDFRMATYVTDPEFNYDDVQPGIFEYATYNGKIAAVPFAISSQVVYYNKDLAKKAGYDLEKNPPKTWEEFAKIAKDIADKTGTIAFDTSDQVWLFKSMLSQNGNPVVEIQGDQIIPVFDNEAALEVGNFWKYMVDNGIMPASSHNAAENTFLSGNLVFIAATSARITKWSNSATFNLGAIEMPYFKQPAVALGGSTATILAKDESKANVCWEIIKYVINTENQADFALTTGYLPIRKSELNVDAVKNQIANNELYKVATKQVEYAWSYTHFGAMGSMDEDLWYATDNIENGMPVQQALTEAVEHTAADIDY